MDLEDTPARDLTPLANNYFYSLSLEGMDIDDFAVLSKIHIDDSLNLSRTNIEDLRPLNRHVHLEYLGLNETKVRDLSPLYGLKDLRHVQLKGTQVSAEEIMKLEAALPDCYVAIDEIEQ